MYGKTGEGYAELLGISDKIDIIQSTMAKEIGIIGGYITGEKILLI